MNFFAVMFLSSVILVITAALALLTVVVRRNLTQIEALQFCVLHLLTQEQKKKSVINNTYHYPKSFDLVTDIADIQALFNKMPTKESEQLADVIQLHGDNLTDKKEKKDD